MKAFNKLTIHELDVVKSSPFFCHLFPYWKVGKTHITLVTEALDCSLREIESSCCDDVTVEEVSFLGTSLLLDRIFALETLHSDGFVHSDLSPGNVCFSIKVQIWKLIDFDHSMPIKESLETGRPFVTCGYRNPQAYETGIVTPVNDYIALAYVLLFGFPDDWPEFSQDFIDLLHEMSLATEIDADWRKSAIEFHRQSCRALDMNIDLTLRYAEQL